MLVKIIVEERFDDYKAPAMFIGCAHCDGKCAKDGGFQPSVCANSDWAKQPVAVVSDDDIIKRYINNPLTAAIVFGLLEPFEQFEDVFNFISKLRNSYFCNDAVVLYTGFDKVGIQKEIEALQMFPNIIVKFGKFIPKCEKHFDPILGVELASPNQYAEKIS